MFNKLNFAKLWTRATDFPTVETSETQVRADLQYHPDAIKDALNALIDALAASTASGNIGATRNGVVGTLQEVLDGISADIASGGMQGTMYDPQEKHCDIFAYADSSASSSASSTMYAHTHPNVAGGVYAHSKEEVGLGNVENTADLNKPVSTATQTALNGKVNTTDTIDVAHGGTGVTTLAAIRALLNLGNGTTNPAKLEPAYGGTGVASMDELSAALGIGNTTAALIPASRGGTGHNTLSGALKTCLQYNNLVLSSFQYGDELPTAGTPGRIFFKKVT